MPTSMLGHFNVGDYDTWKSNTFDRDPAGRVQAAKGHAISRSVDDPNEVFVRVEFGSVGEARAFREKLMSSGALDNVEVRTPPTIVELADQATY
jgi:hypothetical protein